LIDSKNLKYFQIPLVILTLAYMLVEIPYVVIFLWLGFGLISLNILINCIQFKSKRNDLIKLGLQENFNGGLLLGLILFFAVAVFVFFGTKMIQWDFFPVREKDLNPYFVMIIALPQLTQFVLRVLFKGFVEFVYITDQGILFNMNSSEHYLWKDFDSYALLPDLKLIRFRKEKDAKSDFFFVSYEEEHLNQHKEQILTILDENLKREIE